MNDSIDWSLTLRSRAALSVGLDEDCACSMSSKLNRRLPREILALRTRCAFIDSRSALCTLALRALSAILFLLVENPRFGRSPHDDSGDGLAAPCFGLTHVRLPPA